MNNGLKKLWGAFTALLILAAALLAVLLIGGRLLGFQVYAVLSGSMEPAYPVGSIIYVQAVDPAALKPGDVITFRLTESSVATHRIVEIGGTAQQPCFRTKGDANDVADGGVVLAKDVIGKVVFALPCLGYLVAFVHTTAGRWAAVAAGAFVLLLLILPEVLFRSDKQGEPVDP